MTSSRSAPLSTPGKLNIVCGPGGVGKTTTSAAMALASARRGSRTLVCTIDPSRRLRTSLGLTRLAGEPQKVAPHLFAMRLDPKKTFDDLVREHAATPQARERILNNRFYQQISRHLAGTHEVMAMEALLGVSGDFDRIVLDTPPASSALAFLDAPKRVLDFVDGRILKYFLKPYFIAGRLAIEPRTAIGRTLLGFVDSAVGLAFLRDLSEFFLAFEGLFESFRRTASAMEATLRDETTDFILVTTPLASRVAEAKAFADALRARSLRPAAIIANRVHPWAIDGRSERSIPGRRPRSSAFTEPVWRELASLARREHDRAASDRRHFEAMTAASDIPVVKVPEFDTDVHDMRALERVAAWLYREEDAA